MSKSILQMDTDSIKQYVFATNKLRYIRGASIILDELNQIYMPQIIKKETKNKFDIVYSNGGVGEFIVPTKTVGDIINTIETEYRKNGASVTCCYEKLPENMNIHSDDCGGLFTRLAYKMRLRKNGSESITSISNPFFRTCDICHIETASNIDNIDHNRYICNTCYKKQEKFETFKKEINQAITNSNSISRIFYERIFRKLKKLRYPVNNEVALPNELEDIGELSNNYLALLYADGNNMGDKISKLKNFKEHHNFSQGVDEAIFTSLAASINKHLKPENDLYPFDILLLGGDDLIFICKADKALPVAISICNEFYKETNGLSLSLGVAYAHSKFPIRSLLNIAENLLKTAKTRRAKALVDNSDDAEAFKKGAINFMTISNSTSLSFEEYYKSELKNEEASEVFIRTFRPYSPERLHELLELGIKFKKDFPKSKLELLGESLFTNKFNCLLKTLFVYTRSNNTQKKLLDELFKFNNNTSPKYHPWKVTQNSNKTYETAVLDLLELYRFF